MILTDSALFNKIPIVLLTFTYRMYKLVPVLLSLTVQLCLGQDMFTNPILDRNSADPAVLRVGEYYYLTLSENTEHDLTIYKSKNLTSFRDAESVIAYSAPENYSDLWASEMHLVSGDLYIYFTMTGGGKDHRMYAIKADDPQNPMGNWSDAIRLMPDWDFSAIDGTVFQHGNGRMYFLYTTWSFGPMAIYIAPLYEPTIVGFPKIRLKEPSAEWECHEGCVNEGPYFIFRNNVSYCVFSGSSTWGPNYALAVMSIPYNLDPMVISNWKMPDGPVFYRNDEEDVYTTGHAAFTVSPDGTETWMVYHATTNTTHINGYRIARLEKIDWSEEGIPLFPRPHGFNHPQPVPSGQGL